MIVTIVAAGSTNIQFNDNYGLVSCSMCIASHTFPVGYTFAALCMDFDIPRILTVDWCPESPLASIVLTHLRVAIIFYISGESSRTGTHMFLLLLLAEDYFCRISKILATLPFSTFVRVYRKVFIMYRQIRVWYESHFYALLVTVFWLTVIAIWVCIKCTGKIEWPVYVAAVEAAVGVIIFQIYVLPERVGTAEKMSALVKLQGLKARFKFAKRRGWLTFERLKESRAIQPLKMKYGPFFVVDNDFLVGYFNLLVDRLLDMLLLF